MTTRMRRFGAALTFSVLLVGCGDDEASQPSAPTPVSDSGTPDAPTVDAGGSEDRGALAFTGPDPAVRFAAYEEAIRRTAYVSPEGLATIDTTFDAELARARKRFLEARTPADVYYALLSLKNAAHDGHASFFHDPSGPLRTIPEALIPTRPPVVLPLSVRVEYDGAQPRYIVEGKDVPAGSVLESIDGIAAQDLPAFVREWYPLHAREGLHESAATFINYRDPVWTPAPGSGEKAKLQIRSGGPTGTAREVTLEWDAISGGSGAPPPCCEMFGSAEAERDYSSRTPVKSGDNYCVYNTTSATVVRYCSFAYSSRSALVNEQTELLEHLSANPPAKLLFDVRENGGGDFDPEFFGTFATASYEIPQKALYFAPAFRSDPKLLDDVSMFMSPMPDPVGKYRQEMLDNPSATYSEPRPFFCLTQSCAASEATYPGTASSTPYPIAILTGPSCLSSCDDFVAIMRDNGLAKTVGMPPAAADSPFRFPLALELNDKSTFDLEVTVGVSYHPKAGPIMEGNPTKVDTVVLPTAANRGTYLDAVIAALGW